MAAPDHIVAQAKEWIDRVNAGTGMSGGWRLQIVQKRSKKHGETLTKGECDSLPMRIRRFIPGCPWALVDQAIRYLIASAPYTDVIYNGLKLDGTYRPTNTMWTRDEQTSVDEFRLKDGTYTLVQDLIEVDCDDSLETTSGETCSYVETTTYYWDAASIDPLPGCGCEAGACQGVTWSLNAQRQEDGTFNYQVVKRVAKTVHTPPTVVECDALSKVTTEVWDNVYGAPGAFTFDAMCGSSEAITIPDACTQAEGTKVQVQVQKNQDCTYRIVVTTREAKENVVQWEEGTACKKIVSTATTSTKSDPADLIPTPNVGEVVRASAKLNEDGTHDVTVSVTEAQDTEVIKWTEGSACRPTNTTRVLNSKTIPSVPDAKPGETVRASISKNEDCTYNAEVTVVSPADSTPVEYTSGTACVKIEEFAVRNTTEEVPIPEPRVGETVTANVTRNDDCTFDTRYAVRTSQEVDFKYNSGSKCRASEVQVIQNAREMPAVVIPDVGMVQASIRKNDDCTYDATITTTKPAEETVTEWDHGTGCQPEHTAIYQNSAEEPDVPAPEVGQTVQASIRKNDDCTYDGSVTVRTTVPHTDTIVSGTVRKEETTSVFQNVHEKPVVPEPSVGVVVQASLRKNADCTYDGTVSKVTSKPAETEWTEGSSCREVESHHLVNQTSIDIPSPGEGEHVSASVSMNPDGTYDVSYKITKPDTSDPIEFDSGSMYDSEHTIHKQGVKERPTGPETQPAQGVSVRFSANKNSDCTYDSTEIVTTAGERSADWTDGACETEDTHVRVNAKDAVIPVSPSRDVYVSSSIMPNADGTFTKSWRERRAVPVDTGWITWESVEEAPTHTFTYECGLRIFKHLEEVPTINNSGNLNVSVSIDEFCKYSGSISYRKLKSWKMAGHDSGLATSIKEVATREYGAEKTETWRYEYYVGQTVSASMMDGKEVVSVGGGVTILRSKIGAGKYKRINLAKKNS